MEKMMDRKYSDPSRYKNSIDLDDSPCGADGGYTRHGNFIPADAMRELVNLRETAEKQAAEIERLNADRQLQAKLLLAAHKMLMDAGANPSSKDYLDQWAHIRDAEIDRLRAAADLLARVRGNCTIEIVGGGNPTTAMVTATPDLLRELAEALTRPA